MPTTLGEALSSLRSRLDDNLTSVVWTSAHLRQWINEGVKDIARRTEGLRVEDVLTATAGVQEYTLPSDAIRIHKVTYQADDQEAIHTLDYHEFSTTDAVWWTQQAITQSTPHMWTTWGYPPALKLVIYPKPSQDGDLTVYYYKLPSNLATDGDDDDTDLDIPEGWDDAVVLYAEYCALRRDRDPRWQEAKQLYEENVGQLMVLTRTFVDQPGTIVNDRGRVLPGWLTGM